MTLELEDVALRLIAAAATGGLIGVNRDIEQKPIGVRTLWSPMPKMFTPSSRTFWITSDALPSSQPSMVHAADAATNTPKSATMVFGDQLDATIQAAMTVRTAANVRRAESESKENCR